MFAASMFFSRAGELSCERSIGSSRIAFCIPRFVHNLIGTSGNTNHVLYMFTLPADLDGDEYFVTWDPNLLPRYKNYEPMNYTAAPERTAEGMGWWEW